MISLPFFFAGFTSEQGEPAEGSTLARPASTRTVYDALFDSIKATVEAFDDR